MMIVQIAITVIVIVAIVAIAAWFIKSSGINIPQPLIIAFYAIIAILAILFVASIAGIGPKWW